MGARLVAVVLNYRTAGETVDCVRSLLRSARAIDEIVVVENGSGDGSEATLRAALPRVTVLASDENLGFSGGCNLGIARALKGGAERVLLVNSDVALAPDALGLLEDALRDDPRLGIVGPSVIRRGLPDVVESQGLSFSTVTGRMRNLGAGRAPTPGPAGARLVDGVSGCVMLLDAALFARVGRFDEAYFYSFEDLDLCLRARDAGRLTACVPAAIAHHLGSRSIGARSPRRIYFAARNHLRLGARAPSPSVLRQACVVGWNLAFVLLRSPAPRLSGLAALSRGVWHHLRRRYGDAP